MREKEEMETITISMNEYKELMKAYLVYKFKKQELEAAGYVSEIDRVLFEIGKKPEVSAEDDF